MSGISETKEKCMLCTFGAQFIIKVHKYIHVEQKQKKTNFKNTRKMKCCVPEQSITVVFLRILFFSDTSVKLKFVRV